MLNKKTISLVMALSLVACGTSFIPTKAYAAEYNQANYSIKSRSYEGMWEGTVVNCYSLTVHSSTSVNSSAVGWLQKGDTVMVEHSNETDENPSWYCVSYTNSRGKFIRGFVKKSYIQQN